MAKGMMTQAKDAVSDAAKSGAEGVRSVASDAVGAAAKAAAEVVFAAAADALGSGRAKVEQKTPAMTRPVEQAARHPLKRPARKKASAGKAPARRKVAAKKLKKTAKKRPAAKSRAR
jgi:hypothetical protein